MVTLLTSVEDSWTPDNPNAKFPRLTAYKAPLSANNAHSNSGWIRMALNCASEISATGLYDPRPFAQQGEGAIVQFLCIRFRPD